MSAEKPEVSQFDAVMAENWRVGGYGGESMIYSDYQGYVVVDFDHDEDDRECMRAAVAALGKRALALVLKHELDGARPEKTHVANCEWGAVVAEAERLRREPP